MARTYVLRRTQFLPASLEQAWKFFSSPVNLDMLTPADMKFKIIAVSADTAAYAGQIIEYRVAPILNIPVYWMTEITHVEKERFFVDEQRFGPFQFWHHQHHFKPVDGGVEMTDIVHYRVGFSIFGAFAHWLLVKKRLTGIFDYRFDVIRRYSFAHTESTDSD